MYYNNKQSLLNLLFFTKSGEAMFYNNELRFVGEIFKKNRIQNRIININSPIKLNYVDSIGKFLTDIMNDEKTFADMFPNIKKNTIYKFSDTFDFSYIFFLLPDEKDIIFFIGPYLLKDVPGNQILEKSEALGFNKEQTKELEYCYTTIPIIKDEANIYVILNALAERIWGSNKFTLRDIDSDFSGVFEPVLTAMGDSQDKAELNMKIMEERYMYENELMEAVAKGDLSKVEMFYNSFSQLIFEKRVQDPLRNIKNYCIITNTLLRKSAENGGVHPLYIDRLSSEYAKKIEQLVSTQEATKFMFEIFKGYCRLVRNHSIKKFSPVIQKAIVIIDSDLTADLTLSNLAKKCNVSAGYLSASFKRETGATVTDFVNLRRIKYAKKLLKNTNLQIQTIAQHCGVLDVQYFSKIFKKYESITPRQFREKIIKI